MITSSSVLESLSSLDLLTVTRDLVRKSRGVEAELLVHLGEVDERKLYLELAFPSMFAFCVGELGFSEDAAYSRILVARAARRLPAIAEAFRSGQVHLAGLRLLVPHLTPENYGDVLAEASGKSKREIEELIAGRWPQPAVSTSIRKLPGLTQAGAATAVVLEASPKLPSLTPMASPESVLVPASALLPPARPSAASLPSAEHRDVMTPLSEETFKIQFTASRAVRDKLRQAQDLLRHRVPDGNISAILDKALDLLIQEVQKERFAVGRKAGRGSRQEAGNVSSRHIPDAIKRTVYGRDGGRCTFTDERGQRCAETGALEFDHVDGFARTHRHAVDQIRLLCRAHNQYAAEKLYGRALIERARAATCPGTSSRDGPLVPRQQRDVVTTN